LRSVSNDDEDRDALPERLFTDRENREFRYIGEERFGREIVQAQYFLEIDETTVWGWNATGRMLQYPMSDFDEARKRDFAQGVMRFYRKSRGTDHLPPYFSTVIDPVTDEIGRLRYSVDIRGPFENFQTLGIIERKLGQDPEITWEKVFQVQFNGGLYVPRGRLIEPKSTGDK